jgi:hypothetical protein
VNGSSGVRNPPLQTIKKFTNDTNALAIDTNQYFYRNGTGWTHIDYSKQTYHISSEYDKYL